MTTKNTQARNHSSFKRIRKQLLEDDPTCALCGSEANTIDHIIPVDTFTNPIEANTMENCRVLCRPCNSRLGARYVNAKTAGKLEGIDIGSNKRHETTTQSDKRKPLHTNESFFATDQGKPDRKSVV
jgi:5-methylcytosine-specific restriction endonuclease McrA